MINKEIVIIIIILLVFISAYFTIPWLAIGIGTFNSPNPPTPEITYGEFPFKLVYEINDEQKVIEDTVISRYGGIGIGSNKYRKWNSWLASGETNGKYTWHERVILLRIDKTKYIFYLVGSPAYYMGDSPYNAPFEASFSDAWLYNAPSNQPINAAELLSEYGIKIISWEPSPPIVNSFR